MTAAFLCLALAVVSEREVITRLGEQHAHQLQLSITDVVHLVTVFAQNRSLVFQLLQADISVMATMIAADRNHHLIR